MWSTFFDHEKVTAPDLSTVLNDRNFPLDKEPPPPPPYSRGSFADVPPGLLLADTCFAPSLSPQGVTEISIETSQCYGTCPQRIFILREDGSYLLLAGSFSHPEGIFIGTWSHEAVERNFLRAQVAPFGSYWNYYSYPVSDSVTLHTSVVDRHGRHTAYHYHPWKAPSPRGVITLEFGLLDLLSDIEDRNEANGTESLARITKSSEAGPLCRRYGDNIRRSCDSISSQHAVSDACAYNLRIAQELETFLEQYSSEYVEQACAFLLRGPSDDNGQSEAFIPLWTFEDVRTPEAAAVAVEKRATSCRWCLDGLLRPHEMQEPKGDLPSCRFEIENAHNKAFPKRAQTREARKHEPMCRVMN